MKQNIFFCLHFTTNQHLIKPSVTTEGKAYFFSAIVGLWVCLPFARIWVYGHRTCCRGRLLVFQTWWWCPRWPVSGPVEYCVLCRWLAACDQSPDSGRCSSAVTGPSSPCVLSPAEALTLINVFVDVLKQLHLHYSFNTNHWRSFPSKSLIWI